MNIFNESSYRKIISTFIEERKKINSSITYQALSESIRIQKSYLSKVINGRADFNSDQLFMASKFLDLNVEQTEYLQLLLEFEKSGYPERKGFLKNKIKDIQEEKRDAKNNIIKKVEQMDAVAFDSSLYGDYYMDSNIILTHILLTLVKFRENLDLLERV